MKNLVGKASIPLNVLEQYLVGADKSMSAPAPIQSISVDALPAVKLSLILAFALVAPIGVLFANKNLSSHKWAYRVTWSIAFLINILTVSIPGRFDGQTQIDGKPGPPWKTLFEPAGWAFAIWAVIYLGELLLTLFARAVGEPANLLRDMAPFWLIGSIFQGLWCFSFRPEFKSILWLPAFFLAAASISMGYSHYILTIALKELVSVSIEKSLVLFSLRVPLALHASWLAAATLLNINGYATVSNFPFSSQISLAFASSWLASIVGGVYSVISMDPFVAGTIAWALAALANRSQQKAAAGLNGKDKNDHKDILLGLAETEGILSKLMMAVSFGIVSKQAMDIF